ncbi:uncharacterized protein LOC120999093 [Bufo bufo]|uniref:uncharacterized protein LOC120999093 n=1 Tax=Bufo bufo TaxID=8384 RepID=UPI001ABE03C1|nr:uncharacterized protein LOC120999093 [Bufo bufo]
MSHLRDTTQIIEILEGLTVGEDWIMTTLDVQSLYTVIDHEAGLRATKAQLERNKEMKTSQADFILEGIQHILEHNYFYFEGGFYLQIRGTAMGTRFAPSYANLFLAQWEREFIDSHRGGDLVLWRRYIDDIILIWKGDQESLNKFISELNINNLNLTFIRSTENIEIEFLDLSITKVGEKYVCKTFQKPSSRNAFILHSSCHLPNWLLNVPFGQFRRLKRNCTEGAQFEVEAMHLRDKFLAKQYPSNLLEDSLERVRKLSRRTLLTVKTAQNKETDSQFRIILPYTIQRKKIEEIVKRHWHLLLQDKTLGMLMFVAIQVLIWTTPTFAILSLTANPIFTMESLNGTETEQAYTVPLDLVLQNSETDPVTDGGTQENSQSALPSTVTPVLSEATDGGESNIKLQELSTTNIDPKQPIPLDVFNLANTNGPVPTIGSASKETGDNSTLIPLLEPNKAYPFDEQLESFLEIPMENGTEGKQCFCNIPGQKGDKGDTGNGGEPGKVGKRGPQGLEGAKGKKGLSGSKGETGTKGDKGDIGPKGDSETNCALCEKGERGEQGVPGKDGAVVVQGTKGEPGNKGIKGDEGPKGDPGENGSKGIGGVPGIPGEVGPKGAIGPRGPAGLKGDRGMLGPAGPPGYRGPAGIPGRKGDKGQKGAQSDHENVAFSVGVRGHRNVFLPGQPIRFDNVFINENKPYSVKSGVFVANIEGVYFFTYHISLTHSSLMIGLAHNGKIVIQTQVKQYERNVCQASGSVLLHLREDDEIWLQVLTSAQNELISDESDSLFTGFILYSLED